MNRTETRIWLLELSGQWPTVNNKLAVQPTASIDIRTSRCTIAELYTLQNHSLGCLLVIADDGSNCELSPTGTAALANRTNQVAWFRSDLIAHLFLSSCFKLQRSLLLHNGHGGFVGGPADRSSPSSRTTGWYAGSAIGFGNQIKINN